LPAYFQFNGECNPKCFGRNLGVKEYHRLREDLEALVQLAITDEVWQDAAQLAFELRRDGITAPATDVLIASACRVHGCALLHADRHFDLMAERGVGLRPHDVLSLLSP
jgi:predicted nucleic acid-binding protein